jgi:hypothetical protein
MAERQWAGWGGLAGGVVALALAEAAASTLDEEIAPTALVVALVAVLPALVALGAVLALDASALLSLVKGGRPARFPFAVERAVSERFGEHAWPAPAPAATSQPPLPGAVTRALCGPALFSPGLRSERGPGAPREPLSPVQ